VIFLWCPSLAALFDKRGARVQLLTLWRHSHLIIVEVDLFSMSKVPVWNQAQWERSYNLTTCSRIHPKLLPLFP